MKRSRATLSLAVFVLMCLIGVGVSGLALGSDETSDEGILADADCVSYLDPTGSSRAQRTDGDVEVEVVELGCFKTQQASDAASADGKISNEEMDALEPVDSDSLGRDEGSPEGEEFYPRGQKVVIGEDYSNGNYNGDIRYWTARHGCSSNYRYQLSALAPDTGWQGNIESAKGFSGCNKFKHFDYAYFGGPSIVCNCAQMGVLANQTDSLKWANG